MNFKYFSWNVGDTDFFGLIRRSGQAESLLRSLIEEEIVAIVFPDLPPFDDLPHAFLQSKGIPPGDVASLSRWMAESGFTDFDIKVCSLRQSAVDRFSRYLFSPGIEELFLDRKSALDKAVFSLLRVRNGGLARELWIQIFENEVSFPELASRYSDGPESVTKGVIGPVTLGSIEPELAERLRTMRVGALSEPQQMGDWHVVLRLEQFVPSRLDQQTRSQLIAEQFDLWMKHRVNAILAGNTPDSLHYEPDV